MGNIIKLKNVDMFVKTIIVSNEFYVSNDRQKKYINDDINKIFPFILKYFLYVKNVRIK